MNSPIFTLGTGTPTARAESALPPTAKIQLPTLVRSRIQVPIATNSSHHSTVTLTVMNPSGMSEAKIALPGGEPVELGDVVGGHRAGGGLGDPQVDPAEHEERGQRDQE